MLGRGCRPSAAFVSGPHRKSLQSLLVLSLALGCSTGAALQGSSDPDYGRIPLAFIANRGQNHHSVRYTAKGLGLTAYFTPSEVVVDLHGSTIRMQYRGADLSPTVDGLDLQEGRANFLIGNDPAEWRTNVPLYGRVVYKGLYPGIDMVYSSHARLLKSEFVVAPGADPSRIQIEYTGVEGLRVDDRGGLVFTTAGGELREEAPEIYQEGAAGREAVQGAFRVSGAVVSFFVEQYDRTRPLKIDPVLSYSTYLGGSGTERAHAIAVDSSGAAYVTGYTDSIDFPVTPGVLRVIQGGSVDAFVTKLNPAGSAIVYSTYLGGAGDDRGFSIAVNGSGNAYITGYTSSTNFPALGAVQAANGGGRDAFAVKLNPTGTALVYGTYLGGAGTDSGNGIAIDSTGAAYITGSTTSSNYPVLGAWQAVFGGAQDGFVTKLNAAGSAIVYSTYLGGALDDRGSAIAVDTSNAAYIAGNTNSTNFPIVAALQAANNGAQDAFVTKLSAAGAVVYSTYLGGSGTENIEVGRSIAVDSANSAYVVGTTSSTNFPVFVPLQAVNNGGGNDAFVVKLSAAGTALVYSTYLGGASMDFGQSVAVDSGGSAYVGGYTASADFPAVNASQPAIGGNFDAFVAKLNASGSAIADSGFLGGAGADAGYGIAIDAAGSAYLTGQTSSSNFPLLGAVQTSGGTTLAAFIARFTFGPTGPPTAVSVTPSSGTGANQTFTLVYADSRGFADIRWVEMNWNATQATASACYLHYDRATNVLQLSNDAGTGWVGSANPGVAGILQNSQCSVDAGASSASGSGNNLTVNLALTFKPAFAGLKNIYMQLQDVANTLAPWQALGTWTVVAAPPGNVSVTPASGSGINQTFAFVYTDPYGYTDLNWVDILFNTQIAAPSSCFLQYFRASNTVMLVGDSGSGYVGTAVLGTAVTLSNGQCVVNAATSSASGSGNNLTVNLALTFTGTFAGTKNIYMGAVNNAGVFPGWQLMGTWTIPSGGNLPGASVSVTPAAGSGNSQTFILVYSDPYGSADIQWVDVLFNTQIAAPNSCFVQYFPATNTIALVADSGSGYAGTAIMGSANTIANSQCSVNAAASTVSVLGNNLTVSLSLVFKPAFSGAKNIFMGVVTNATFQTFSGWQQMGVFTAQDLTPTSVSVSQAPGASSYQQFTFVYSDPAGYTDIQWVDVLFNTQIAAPNSCFLQYFPATGAIVLVQDVGSGYAGTITLGSAGTVNNSQCLVNSATSTVTSSGNTLTVTLSISFYQAFAGNKNIYMGVVNNANVFSGWQLRGAWTVPGPLPPATVSVAPASGAGSAQTFAFTYTDPYGNADINLVDILINTQIVAASSCFVQYFRGSNTLTLVADSGNGYAGTAIIGTAGSMTNSQCTVNPAASSLSVNGNNLTLTVAVTFKPAFNGAKNIYMGVFNNANVFSDWVLRGAWTVQ